jgi:hypothetical protein
MGARSKLNTIVIWVCLIVSALIGIAAESWGVFWGVLVVSIGGCYSAGDIRMRPDRRTAHLSTGDKVHPHAARGRRPGKNAR